MSTAIAPSGPSVALTMHARQRAQQRAISLAMLKMLLDHGEHRPAARGAEIVHFTMAARRECAAEMKAPRMAKLGSAYAVIGGDGVVITVAHRFRRLSRRR